MSRNLPDNVSSREFDAEADWLADKPMGRCPWCDGRIRPPTNNWGTKTYHAAPYACSWDDWESELENRARYQEERMAEALVNERVNREVARGKDAPY